MSKNPAVAVVTQAITSDQDAVVAAKQHMVLMGYDISESAGTPAAAEGKIVHGATVAAGTLLTNSLSMNANGRDSQWFGPMGIACPNGLSVDWVSGEFDIILYYTRH